MLSNCGEPAQCEVGQALCLKFLKWLYSPAEWLYSPAEWLSSPCSWLCGGGIYNTLNQLSDQHIVKGSQLKSAIFNLCKGAVDFLLCIIGHLALCFE